ncbi:MAG: DUF1971 domain-containing protein [Leptolyngbyaceae cyanobacterium]
MFNQDTVPPALLNRHTTKAGSWAKIWVISGQLGYKILTETPEEHRLTPDFSGIVEPKIFYCVELCGPVEFYVEFYSLSS